MVLWMFRLDCVLGFGVHASRIDCSLNKLLHFCCWFTTALKLQLAAIVQSSDKAQIWNFCWHSPLPTPTLATPCQHHSCWSSVLSLDLGCNPCFLHSLGQSTVSHNLEFLPPKLHLTLFLRSCFPDQCNWSLVFVNPNPNYC